MPSVCSPGALYVGALKLVIMDGKGEQDAPRTLFSASANGPLAKHRKQEKKESDPAFVFQEDS